MDANSNTPIPNTPNTPQIRFPEFEGEWEELKLRDIANFSKGKGISKDEIDENGKLECIRYGELYTHYGETISEVKSRTNVDRRSLVLSEENDVIIPASGESHIDIATASCVLRSGIALGGDLNVIKTKNNGVFLSYYLNNKKKIEIASLSQGISVVHLYSSQLERLNLNFPTLPEQQKIASFFTAIDQKLTHLKRKKTLLEDYKKGVMQKIFAQEIRFKIESKDGVPVEPPKWERKRLGEVYTFRSTNSFSRDNLNYDKGIVKNIHYGDIHTKFKTLFDINNEEVPYINQSINVVKISSSNYCLVKDLVFADASEDLFDVGKCIEVVNLNTEKVLAGLHTILARPDKYGIALGFGGYLMKSQFVRKQIMKIAQGSKVSSISPSRLSEIELNLPSLPEQTKIANFLSGIDKKIKGVAEAIEATERWKRGVMGRMFV